VSVAHVVGVRCVDVYEAGASADCPVQHPANTFDTVSNLNDASCQVVSEVSVVPWRFITRDQAMQMCARAGKRLPTSSEWYQLSLDMVDGEQQCNTNTSQVLPAGDTTACVSSHGIFDMVGNVWEWVGDDVIDGVHNGRALPPSGYVTQVDAGGIAVYTADTPSEVFGSDFFWSNDVGAFGMIRGGYYDSDTDAGIYTVHADTPPNFAGAAIGFRCVK